MEINVSIIIQVNITIYTGLTSLMWDSVYEETISLDCWKKSFRIVYAGDLNLPATIWTCKFILIGEHLQITLGYTLASCFSRRKPFLDIVSDNYSAE